MMDDGFLMMVCEKKNEKKKGPEKLRQSKITTMYYNASKKLECSWMGGHRLWMVLFLWSLIVIGSIR